MATTALSPPPPALAGECLYRFEGRLTRVTPLGATAAGARFDSAFEAAIVDGRLGAGRLTGFDRFLLRPDGVGVVDAHLTMDTRLGVVHSHAHGYVLPPPGAAPPSPAAVADPAFAWPDVDLEIVEVVSCESGAPGLRHLNSTVAAGRGTVNMATGRLVVEARALAA